MWVMALFLDICFQILTPFLPFRNLKALLWGLLQVGGGIIIHDSCVVITVFPLMPEVPY